MATPMQPRILAEVGGLAVAEHGPVVMVVDRGTGALATATFVLGVLATVVGGFGGVSLALALARGSPLPWWLGTCSPIIGLAAAVAAVSLPRRIRRANARPLNGHRPVALFDRARRVFVDADGSVVATLDQIRFDTRRQLTSSSRMLVVATPGGTRILTRGNPFNGGIGDLATVLTAAVFAPPR